MSSPERLDHWRTSLDSVEALRARIAEVADPREDLVARQLMAQVALAKSSSFTALLDADGHVLDVNPTALIAGGVDPSEVTGLPLWTTPWWSAASDEDVESVKLGVLAAAKGRFARFDVGVRVAGREPGTLDLMIRPLRGRDG